MQKGEMLRSPSSRGLRPLRNVPFRHPKPEIPFIPEFFAIILALLPVPTATYYYSSIIGACLLWWLRGARQLCS